MIRRIALTLVAAVMLSVGLVSGPQPAQAAGSCTPGPKVRQPIGNVVPTVWCPTWTGTTVYYWPYVAYGGPPPTTANQSGYLYRGTSWMVCQFRGNQNPRFGASGYNDYWLLTQGDVGYRGSDGWGYVPATAVSYGGNNLPIPGVPICRNGGWY